jgi:hypothetical protein
VLRRVVFETPHFEAGANAAPAETDAAIKVTARLRRMVDDLLQYKKLSRDGVAVCYTTFAADAWRNGV